MTEVPVDELRQLLAEPLDRFVAVRNARVKALRAEGHREAAALLASVRKPSRLTARVAVLARADPDAAAGAVQAAEDLEAAQEGDGDLREAMAAVRPAIDAVLRSASALDRVDLGFPLRTVLADPEVRQAWLDGILLRLPGPGAGAPPAFTGRHLTLVPTGAHVEDRRRGSGKRPRPDTAEASPRADDERRAVEARAARRRTLEADAEHARAALETAREELDEAHAALADAEARQAAARRELAAAGAAIQVAHGVVADARQRAISVEQSVVAAHKALDGD